jgi:hypothetical protein
MVIIRDISQIVVKFNHISTTYKSKNFVGNIVPWNIIERLSRDKRSLMLKNDTLASSIVDILRGIFYVWFYFMQELRLV